MPLCDVAFQKLYLYTKKWDSKKDSSLIISLLSKNEECKPLLPTESMHAIIDATDALNNTYNAGFRVLDVEKRIEFLWKRYVTFKELTNMPETDWEMPTNKVHADDAVWARFFVANEFYKAYYFRWEPEFFQLASLFGADDVKKEASHTVIIISDSAREVKEASQFIISDSSSDDEVTSPLPNTWKPVNRKLFTDDASSSISPFK